MGAQPAYSSLVVVNHGGTCSLLTSVTFQPRVVFGFDPLPRCPVDGGFLSLCQAFTYFTEGGTSLPVDGQELKVLVTYFESETRGGVRVAQRIAVEGIKRVGRSLVSPGVTGALSWSLSHGMTV